MAKQPPVKRDKPVVPVKPAPVSSPSETETVATKLLAGSTVILALATVFLGVATYLSYQVLDKTDKTLKSTMVARNRAWVNPHLLKLTEPLKLDAAAELLLYFGNTGNEPAINVRHHVETTIAPNWFGLFYITPLPPNQRVPPHLYDNIEKLKLADTCVSAREKKFSEGAIFPSSVSQNTRPISVDKKFITQQVIDGSENIIVTGCIVYETMNDQHQSKFCFFYNSREASKRPSDQKEFWLSCSSGNDAN